MQVAAAGTGVRLSDGSTNVLPVGDTAAVRAAWDLHARLVRRSLERGFYQGWDLHPAQLPTRFGATYAFFREAAPAAVDRLGRYLVAGAAPASSTSRPRRGRWPGSCCAASTAARWTQSEVEFDRSHAGGASDRSAPLAPGGAAGRGARRPRALRDGRIAAIAPYDRAARRRPRRPRAAARPGRHPRARQRARPHRVGGLRHAPPGPPRPAGSPPSIDMPLNSHAAHCGPSPRWRSSGAAAGRQCHVDVGFWGGAVPGNAGALPALHEAGVFGFKCFLIDSGVPEFPPLDPAGLQAALAGRRRAVRGARRGPGRSCRPPSSRALRGLRRVPPAGRRGRRGRRWRSAVARATGARVHILHLSAAGALPLLARGPGRRGPVTAETCPHYLTLAAEDMPDGATAVQVLPADPGRGPTRTRCGPGLADGDDRLRGVRPLAVHARPQAARHRRLRGGLGRDRLPAARPAGGLDPRPPARPYAGRRGALDGPRPGRPGRAGRTRAASRSGADADLVAFDPTATCAVDPAALHHRHPVTPYAGQTLRGVGARPPGCAAGRWTATPRGTPAGRETR